MAYKRFSISDADSFSKEWKHLLKYPVNLENAEFLSIETEFWQESEFLHKKSTFHYYIVEGSWLYHLDDEIVPVARWDLLSIEPWTRIWYEWKLKMILLCNPPWTEEDEVSFGVKNPYYLTER